MRFRVERAGVVAGLLAGGALVSCQSGLEFAGGPWPHEPVGSAVLTDYDWGDSLVEGPLGTSGWEIVGSQGDARVNDPTAPFSKPYVIQMAFPSGFGGGTEPCNAYFQGFPGGDRKELYVAFWWKASNPWQGHSSGVNKLGFFYTGSGSGGRYALIPEMFGSGNGPYYLRTALFELGTSEPRDWAEPNVGNGALVPGVWYQLEFYMKYGSSSSSHNGVLMQWVNGVLVTNYTDLNYVNGGFDSVELSPTWGGTGDTKHENDYFRYDHIRISGK